MSNAQRRRKAKQEAKAKDWEERRLRGCAPSKPWVVNGTRTLPENYSLAEDHKKKKR